MKLQDLIAFDNLVKTGSNSNTNQNSGAKDGYDLIPPSRIPRGQFNAADVVDTPDEIDSIDTIDDAATDASNIKDMLKKKKQPPVAALGDDENMLGGMDLT